MLSDYACGEDEFSCSNHKCVPISLKCNGQNDCGDNSDETKDCIGISLQIIKLVKYEIKFNFVTLIIKLIIN